MTTEAARLSFTDLLEMARASEPQKLYALQTDLIEQYRSTHRAFMATIPIRHLFRCEVCGLQAGEALMHFEDPKQPLQGQADRLMWGTPVGRHVGMDRSALHRILVHGADLPPAFRALLQQATP